MDPASIVALVGAIIGAIYSAAPILAPLWRKIKAYYGRGCKTTGQYRLKKTSDLHISTF